MGNLIPFVEELKQNAPNTKFVVIIDEFEDLNPAFYTGNVGGNLSRLYAHFRK